MDKLNWWDRNASSKQTQSKWSWSEAQEIVLTSFNELSPEIAKIASKFLIKIGLMRN